MIQKTCPISGQPFTVTDEDLAFYEKMGVPAPTLCPEERQRRRLAWRNERTLYKRKCDGTGKTILSIYNKEASFPVYTKEYWWSDHWEALDYGQNFDFKRPFFNQFFELQNKVPRMSLIVESNELCEFVSMAGWCKNCYMIFEGERNHDCLYSEYIYDCKSSTDLSFCRFCELCYESINCENCYDSSYLEDCENCSESHFLKNCIGCQNCFGCINLRNKKYHFLNKAYSPEEYQQKLSTLKFGSYDQLKGLRTQFNQLCQKHPHKFYTGKMNEEGSGDYLKNCKSCWFCFDTEKCHDGKFLYNSISGNDCFDVNLGLQNAEQVYECSCVGHGAQRVFFTNLGWENLYEIYYSETCTRSQHLFGCNGIRNKKHCILNKSYTAHEYETLKAKIIEHMKETGEWGEFFPIALSPFAYNETVAQEYFPLSKEEALKQGYRWRAEDKQPATSNQQLVKISDDIKDVPDSICNEVLYCDQSGKPYKIQKAELKFYRKMNLPIPRLHPDIRHQERMKLRNPRKLWSRKCSDCQKAIQTTYAPERPEKVLCEDCYLKIIN